MSFELSLSPSAFTPQAPTTATAGRAFVDAPEGTALLALGGSDTPEARSLVFGLPSTYSEGTITARFSITAASATSGNVKLDLQWRRQRAGDVQDRAFAALQSATIARVADPDEIQDLEITFSTAQIDGAVPGDDVQLRLTRDNSVSSNAAGNIWVLSANLSEG